MKKYAVVASLVLVAFLYQNCGPGFESETQNIIGLESLPSALPDGAPIDGVPDGTPVDPAPNPTPEPNPDDQLPTASISLPAGENWALVLNENFDGSGPIG